MPSVRSNPAPTTKGRPSPAAKAADTFEIPMKRLHPAWFAVVALAAVAVIAVIVITRGPSTARAPATDSTVAPAGETKEQLAARREHMQITQKSMAEPAAQAPAAATPAAQAAAPVSAAPASRAAAPSPGRTAAAAQPAPPKPVPRKQLDALDRLGDDLASGLK